MTSRKMLQAFIVSILLVLLSGLPAYGKHGHKLWLEYAAFPDNFHTGETETPLEICVINHGQARELIFGGRKHNDQIEISIPIGSVSNDLIDDPTNIYCTIQNQDWTC